MTEQTQEKFPRSFWTANPLMSIGLLSALSMWLYHRWLIRKTA